MTRRIFITLFLMVTLSKYCNAIEAMRTYWFSPYGLPEHGRQIEFEGDNLGKMTMVQCSRKCADDDLCNAYQFQKTEGRIGVCYTFKSLTYNRIMIASPGHQYFEKRNCFDVYHITAGVMFPSELRLFLFADDKTFVFNVIVQGNIIRLQGTYLSYHNYFFPGVTGTVDGAFQGPSDSTYIVQGNKIKCFKPQDATYTRFDECGSALSAMLNIMNPYFATESSLDAIVELDDSFSEVHVIKNNTVHRLSWSNADTRYNVIESFPIEDTRSINNWSNAPINITAMTRMADPNIFLLTEGSKITMYNTASKKVVGIMFLCVNN